MLMSYTATYETADLDDIIIDMISMVFAVIVANIEILVDLIILTIIATRGKAILNMALGFIR